MANGRDDWIGWFDLKQEHVKETAVENTARVARELNADVFCVIEAEHRTALNRFNDAVIPKVGGLKYSHVMLIDGNDDRAVYGEESMVLSSHIFRKLKRRRMLPPIMQPCGWLSTFKDLKARFDS